MHRLHGTVVHCLFILCLSVASVEMQILCLSVASVEMQLLCLSVASMEMQANLYPAQSAKWISTLKVGAHMFIICDMTTQNGLVELVHRHLQAAQQPQNNTILQNWLMCEKSHTTQHHLAVAHQQAVYVDRIEHVLFYHYARCHHSQLQCRQQSARVSRIVGCCRAVRFRSGETKSACTVNKESSRIQSSCLLRLGLSLRLRERIKINVRKWFIYIARQLSFECCHCFEQKTVRLQQH